MRIKYNQDSDRRIRKAARFANWLFCISLSLAGVVYFVQNTTYTEGWRWTLAVMWSTTTAIFDWYSWENWVEKYFPYDP